MTSYFLMNNNRQTVSYNCQLMIVVPFVGFVRHFNSVMLSCEVSMVKSGFFFTFSFSFYGYISKFWQEQNMSIRQDEFICYAAKC